MLCSHCYSGGALQLTFATLGSSNRGIETDDDDEPICRSSLSTSSCVSLNPSSTDVREYCCTNLSIILAVLKVLVVMQDGGDDDDAEVV